jgi:hypothetical protein
MSSKVYGPGNERPFGPLVWRVVGSAKMAPAAGEPAPDTAAQIAQLEAQYQQKVREAHAAGVREGEIAGRNRAAA